MRKRCRVKRYKRGRGVFAAILLLFFTLLFLVVLEIRMRPVMQQVAQARANSLTVSVINEEVNRTIMSESLRYGDLVTLQKDGDGRVSAVTSNVLAMNRLKAELAVNIQTKMREIDKMTTKIPIGTLLSNGLLAGYGPKVALRLTPIGYADVDISDSFTQAGINQTRHEIRLVVTATMRVLLPISSTVTEVSTGIPVAQTVIIGTVPNTFTNVEGVTSAPPDTMLNIID